MPFCLGEKKEQRIKLSPTKNLQFISLSSECCQLYSGMLVKMSPFGLSVSTED